MHKRYINILLGILCLVIASAGLALLLSIFHLFITFPVQDKYTYKNENNEIADWKTYANVKYGFSIKYPDYFTARPSGAPDELTQFSNTDENINVYQALFGLYRNIQGPIIFAEALKQVKESQSLGYEKGGVVRVVKNFTISNKNAITYETVGYPSRIPDITTVIDNNGGTIILDIYGNKEINI